MDFRTFALMWNEDVDKMERKEPGISTKYLYRKTAAHLEAYYTKFIQKCNRDNTMAGVSRQDANLRKELREPVDAPDLFGVVDLTLPDSEPVSSDGPSSTNESAATTPPTATSNSPSSTNKSAASTPPTATSNSPSSASSPSTSTSDGTSSTNRLAPPTSTSNGPPSTNESAASSPPFSASTTSAPDSNPNAASTECNGELSRSANSQPRGTSNIPATHSLLPPPILMRPLPILFPFIPRTGTNHTAQHNSRRDSTLQQQCSAAARPTMGIPAPLPPLATSWPAFQIPSISGLSSSSSDLPQTGELQYPRFNRSQLLFLSSAPPLNSMQPSQSDRLAQKQSATAVANHQQQQVLPSVQTVLGKRRRARMVCHTCGWYSSDKKYHPMHG
ncbi:hypothetical protein HK102_006396, partial [Quaeritorhiza haematococci]